MTWTRAYGASGWHLALVLVSIGLVGYVVATLGLPALWDPEVWWQSIIVWFVGAVVVHDLVLFPAYALADRVLTRRAASAAGPLGDERSVPITNYVRVPTMLAGFTFLLFFPGILRQGADSFNAATGMTQDPYLERWLLLVAAGYLLSGLAYAVVMLRTRQRR
jgi:uncharacterized membrane protein YeaQ/YmgE (transglycosylase-associated protein family)